MIVVYAGRRAQSLPARHQLEARLMRLIGALEPRVLVGAAADGGDLLVLEAALSRPAPPRIHLVLPTEPDVFAEASVADAWRDRYSRVLDRVRELGGTVESLGLPDGEDAYRAANARMVELAESLAADGTVAGERAVALLCASPGEGAMITDLAETARLRAVPHLRLDPAVDLAQRPACFVAMPFGRKLDVQRSIEINCDLLYQRVLVPALENAQVRYRRADEEIDSGVVLVPMIEWLADADLVIGDLATANFNVGWELGLRHLLKHANTLLMLPSGTVPPFDLNALRHVQYRLDESGIADGAAIEAWAALAPYLDQLPTAPERPDSPVAAVLDVRRWAEVRPRDRRDGRFEALREQLALARDMRDTGLMLELAAEAEALGAEAARVLRAEAGVGLVRLKAFRDAARLLAPLVEADDAASRPEAHVYYAQALYRDDDATIADYDEAEHVLRRVLVKRPGHPEVWAGIGAVAKRRSRKRRAADRRRDDLRVALEAYAHDYERNLGLFYEGINVVAFGLVLERVHGDERAGERARRVVDAVKLAAELKLQRNPREFWAAVTAAEAELHAALLGMSDTPRRAVDAYAAAGALRPAPGDLHSSLSQFDWLSDMGVTDPLLDEARAALETSAR